MGEGMVTLPLLLTKKENPMKHTLEKGHLNVVFESLKEFFSYTEQGAPYNNLCPNISDLEEMDKDASNQKKDSWTFGRQSNYSEYYKERLNPNLGKELSKTQLQALTRSAEYKKLLTQALTYRQKMRFQDIGNRISVPHAIAGDDKYFVVTKSASKPTAKIAINMAVSACVDTEDLIKISCKAVPLIKLLEASGIPTEAWIIFPSCDSHEGVNTSIYEVKIKSAQQRFSWTTFAPVFCSGIWRYNMFRAFRLEHMTTAWGLGRPMGTDTITDKFNNFGYTSIIGANGPGPIDSIKEVFKKLKQ